MTEQTVYDAVPYPILSHSDTHPDKFATIATLLGLNPPDVTHCRVLELGCASGGNLTPMAEALPNSTFVGVDNAERQIEQARERAQKLNLGNCTFETMDILDIEPDFGEFDYIIAHGVYSWVAEDVRDHLLRICKQNLAPNGLAYVSYNTHPGWHSLLVIRDLMLWHTRNVEDPMQRMEYAYGAVAFITQAMKASGHSPMYTAYLEHYMTKRFQYNKDTGEAVLDTSLLHDEMEAVNHPVYFHEFIAHAAEHDLQYVAEVPFVQVFMPDIPEDVKQQLNGMANNLIEMEQYTDYIRHRTFRRTLLCHAHISFERKLSSQTIAQFYIGSRAKVAEDPLAPPNVERYIGNDDVALSTDHPVTKAALHYLIDTRAVLPFDDLLTIACQRLQINSPTEQDRSVLAGNLLQGYSSSTELVELFSHNPGIVIEPSEKPVARPVARLDAMNFDQPTTTNLKHERVTLDGFIRMILPYLDGQHDRDALLDKLVEHIAAGHIAIRDEHGELLTKDNGREVMASQVDVALRWMARSGLLAG